MKRKEIPNYKNQLFISQGGLCALTGLALKDSNSSHLDHDHILTGPEAGRIRGLLCPQANVLEGRIKHQFKRSGLDGKIDYIDFLKRLIQYLEKDYTSNPVHPQIIPDLKNKFKRMNLSEMKDVLKDYDTTGKTKKELEETYSQYLKVKYGTSNENRESSASNR
ncbi:endonuclease VII [Klebsiella aerogenes]|uniref:endonuclease domain-containing protein n=1 Tax=Klebsiella aerogenes TaxID=548 RepID=UPI000C773A7F|nr:endonuclease domain-containing protein [Klebsiella aerogenes]EKT3979538.1 endonuclease VII [Klebsiella aerogenes]PLC39116.1 endonuclease VII [Klebsiella aerogenes]WPR92358.1 endonuclease domain-containing protein [Klebsiella aerogenes]